MCINSQFAPLQVNQYGFEDLAPKKRSTYYSSHDLILNQFRFDTISTRVAVDLLLDIRTGIKSNRVSRNVKRPISLN